MNIRQGKPKVGASRSNDKAARNNVVIFRSNTKKVESKANVRISDSEKIGFKVAHLYAISDKELLKENLSIYEDDLMYEDDLSRPGALW